MVRKSAELGVKNTYINENISSRIDDWDRHKRFLPFPTALNGCKTFSTIRYLSKGIANACFSKDTQCLYFFDSLSLWTLMLL